MERVIGVGEYIISHNVSDVLKIYGLGSCIGMVMHCPIKNVVGVAHFLLPSSEINAELSKISPAYFVDTGVDVLLNKICNTYYVKKENILVSIYGGADGRIENDIFNIGKRNVVAVNKKISEYNLKLKASDTGGKFSRTISASVETGIVSLNIQENIVI